REAEGHEQPAEQLDHSADRRQRVELAGPRDRPAEQLLRAVAREQEAGEDPEQRVREGFEGHGGGVLTLRRRAREGRMRGAASPRPHSASMKATRSCFSSAVSFRPSTRLKNSTVSSSVSSRSSCRYGG